MFLEVGSLKKSKGATNPAGRVTIMVEADWRIEKPRSIETGSGFSSARIDSGLAALVGVRINRIEIQGRAPEINISLDNGKKFCTFTNWHRQPAWSIGFQDHGLFPLDPNWSGIDVNPWIHIQSGRPVIEYCYDDTEAFAGKAVKRMGFK
ncbi:MAG: hypothetical protein KDA78_20270 [Planctomycetaceae bacterium]|nr:hypothetical protein [Planctomycetaceae bacterium]